ILIDDMESELGEAWGDLGFEDALLFLDQPDAATLEFIAIAVDADDESDLSRVTDVIRKAKSMQIKVILVANEVSPMALHQLMRLGADDFVPYPLPEGALHDAVERIRRPEPEPAAAAPAPVEDEAPAPTFKAKGDRQGVLLPVPGMAGGCGTSTFAVNLAWELATVDKDAPRVCLMDLNFQYGSAATYLDLPRKEAIFEILTDPTAADADSLIKTMQTFNDRLHV